MWNKYSLQNLYELTIWNIGPWNWELHQVAYLE